MPTIIRMSWGLANRMFQYSYYLYLRQRGVDAYIDYCGVLEGEHERVDWKHVFPQAPLRQATKGMLLRYGGGTGWIAKFRRHALPCTTSVHYHKDAMTICSDDELQRYHYLMGVFQNVPMVLDVADLVRRRFRFSTMKDGVNRGLIREMSEVESVAVHVRKGHDYQRLPWFAKTCLPEYYERAFEEMRRRIGNPQFYVFTDNPEWVRQNMPHANYRLIDWNPVVGKGCHWDMQLMASCKHQIIANSTYSWWAAFLNNNQQKQVIAPKQWFAYENYEGRIHDGVQCPEWTLM